MALAVSTAAVITLGAGVSPSFAIDRILSPEEPGYLKDLRANPAKYEAFAQAQDAIANLPKSAPAVAVAKKAAPKAAKTVKASPKAASAPKAAVKVAPKPPSLQPPKGSVNNVAPSKQKKAKYDSGNAAVEKKAFGGLSGSVLVGSLATALFFASTKDEEFSPTTSKPKAVKTQAKPKPNAAAAANAKEAQAWIDASNNAKEAQEWINAWRHAPVEEEALEANAYAAEAAQANAKAAQEWIDAWVATDSDKVDVEASQLYVSEAAAARAAEAQRWINDWSSGAKNNVISTKKVGLFGKIFGGLFGSKK